MNGARNVLIVANEAIEGSEIMGSLREHLGGQTVRIYLITPALVDSPLDHQMGQVDEAIGPARERLDRSLAELGEAGIDATGAVADADPVIAISDELQKFPADEIVLISHTEEDRAFAERNLLEKVSHEFSQPLTQLVVTRPGPADVDEAGPPASQEHPQVVDVTHEERGADRDTADLEPSENLPPLQARDIAAIAIGIVGTLALVIIAASCAIDGGGMTGVCAIKALIALGALLINGGHIIAIVFFGSLRHEGILDRFASTFTITVTPLAVIVSLLI